MNFENTNFESHSWKPTTTHAIRVRRAQILAQVRQFFAERDVLEVDTPLLSHGSVTDVHLTAFATEFDYASSGQQEKLYLQTSPEFAMKRLLCAGSGPIYQICKAFRHEGHGRWHNPEFTMLEWYRPNFTDVELMQEVDALLQLVLNTSSAHKASYQTLFIEYLGVDPLVADEATLDSALNKADVNINDPHTLSRDSKLQLLFSCVVEPSIGQDRPCFVYNFPASQAALAKINQQDKRVAHRFEVYYRGAELANGYYELADVEEQKKRFIKDNQQREALNLPAIPLDEHFLAALDEGLPDCAGVALGLDRLIMLAVGASHIQEVINFPIDNA